MTQDQAGSVRLRDAKPEGVCTQTFFRNHDVISQMLKMGASKTANLHILDIGGGVLEPLLVSALCEILKSGRKLDSYQVQCIDISAEVKQIQKYMRKKKAYILEDHKVLNEAGNVMLPGLAHIFSATHDKVNTWLNDSTALSGQIQGWIDLGVAPYLGIPPDVCHSSERMQSFLEAGLSIQNLLFKHIHMIHGDAASVDSHFLTDGCADLILSNYALQYPIWEGKGKEVIANLERWMAPSALLQISNAYPAQQLLLALIDNSAKLLKKHCLEVSLREVFIVPQYFTDDLHSPPRLVPRADVFFAPAPDCLPATNTDIIRAFTQSWAGSVVPVDSLAEIVHLMATHTGLEERSSMIFHAQWNPETEEGYACLLERETLLSFGRNPMRAIGLFD